MHEEGRDEVIELGAALYDNQGMTKTRELYPMPAPIRLINDATLSDADPIDADSVVGGRPVARFLNFYTNASGTFTAGVWECSPGTLRVDCYPVDEYCWLISGEVVLIDENGNQERFVAGEGFVVPKGFVGTWHMPTAVRKHYVILEESPT